MFDFKTSVTFYPPNLLMKSLGPAHIPSHWNFESPISSVPPFQTRGARPGEIE
jgi:hypothetical protein